MDNSTPSVYQTFESEYGRAEALVAELSRRKADIYELEKRVLELFLGLYLELYRESQAKQERLDLIESVRTYRDEGDPTQTKAEIAVTPDAEVLTPRWWFQQVGDPNLRQSLLHNLNEHPGINGLRSSPNVKYGELHHAIQYGFDWGQTQEGKQFWSGVTHNAREGRVEMVDGFVHPDWYTEPLDPRDHEVSR